MNDHPQQRAYHEGKLLSINNINATTIIIPSKCRTRIRVATESCQVVLKSKTRESVYESSDTSNMFNPLKMKRRLFYLKTQFIPCSKRFSTQL